MKLVTYYYKNEVKVGIIGSDAGKIVPTSELGYQATDMTAFISELGGVISPDLLNRVDATQGIPLEQCKLLAPIKYPAQDVICLGCNYVEHRNETDTQLNITFDIEKEDTIYFGKRVNEAVDPYGFIDGHFDIVERLDYEVELAAILGKDAKNVTREDAEDYVIGYTILNDISARDIQSKHQQWYFGKSMDEFTPIGPWIVTKDELGWKPSVGIRSFVNGELRQDATTDMMIKDVDEVIAELSKGMTLKAGTIIALGTPAGVGAAQNPPQFMKTGDVIRCEIDGIGVLENTVR